MSDSLQLFSYLLTALAVVSLWFRRVQLLRIICVAASVAAVYFASVHIDESHRMAVRKLDQEGRSPGDATFADGARYTLDAAKSALSLFATAAVVLAALALVPLQISAKDDKSPQA